MTTRRWIAVLAAVFVLMGEARGQTCGITNSSQPFSVLSITHPTNSVILTWSPTCTNYAFGVFSTDQLTSNSQYQARAGMWGSLSGTSQYTDVGVTNRARFYKVLRIQPTSTSDWDGDGIPDVFELNHGLNPFSSTDATNDLDGDGYSNFDEALMNSDPTNPNDPITVYVDGANTNGVYDGTQAHPFRSMQDAVESSVDVSSNLAIRVRPGTYYETVSNLQYNPSTGDLLSSRQFLYIYAANNDWSLSTDPESHIIDALNLPNIELVDLTSTAAPVVEFNGVTRARITGFTIRGGQGPYGGGILAYSTNGPVYISNCIVEKNGSAGTEAGGIYIQAATNSLIYNTVVARNTGIIGAVFDVNGSRIWNCTILSNVTLSGSLGALTGDFGAPNVRNSVIWNVGLDLYFADVDYSTFGSNKFSTVGAHTLFDDPQLVSTAFGNYRLSAGSLLISAGAPLPVEQRDLYGNGRPLGGRFDIGANQYTDTDGDGMQDDWETKHGLLPGSSADGTGNPDGDGFNNLDEYKHNTDPHNSDTDGDGIPDDQDPDPTTPDVSLNTVFWDYFFASQFEAYIDDVPHPEWINEPITRPRAVVLNNYHIGDHVDFQWKYLGGPGDQPIITFYVPQTTQGSVIPAPDATPLNQFTIGGNGFVPASKWRIIIAQTTPTDTNVCQGFDDESLQFPIYQLSTPALSVPQFGTNTFTVPINPSTVVTQVSFLIVQTNLASETPSTPLSATQLVSVVGHATGTAITNTEFRVLGIGAQNTFTTTCSRVAIDILPMRTNVTVAIWAVTAKGEPGTAPTQAPTQTQLKSYLDGLYGKQANALFNVLPLVSTNVNYDLNTNGVLEVETNDQSLASAEQAAITNAAFRAGAVNIYYVRSISASNNAVALSYPPLKTAFVQDVHDDSSVNVTAHELGHHMGITYEVGNVPGHPNMPGNPDRLMGLDSGSDPCRLIRSEWIIINNGAAAFH